MATTGMATHVFRVAPDDARRSAAARARARLHGWRHDQTLAGGASPDRDPTLAARAAWLVRTQHRMRLAAGIEQLVRDTAQGGRPRSVPVVPHRPTIRLAAPELMELADRLRGRTRVEPCGMARLRVLLADPDGPLYGTDPTRLRRALAVARDGLDRGGP